MPTIEPLTINVGGRLFTTLPSTLTQSPFFATLLSDDWAQGTSLIDDTLFIDRNPLLFDRLLNFLRSSHPPIFWTRTNGFDLALYAALLRKAEYFQIEALAAWIRDEKYISTIQITPSTELETTCDCRRGLASHFGDVEKEFEADIVHSYHQREDAEYCYKRLQVRKTRLCPPVSRGVYLAHVVIC